MQRPKDYKCISYHFSQMRHFFLQMLQKVHKIVTFFYLNVTLFSFNYL